jgi:c(7)-type cytochrome triheme protein
MCRAFLLAVLCICVGCGGSASEPAAEPKAELKAVEVAPVAPAVVANSEEPQGSEPQFAVPPETILFASEYGNVTFGHRKHFERVNSDCATCHPAIFPQAREALNYGKARHRVAEEYKTSCASCHGIKGTAFAAERNCQKCHDMGLPKH